MKRGTVFLLFALAGWPLAAAAQEPSNLNDTQRHGQQLLAQTCGVCHLKGAPNAPTYGPPLNKAAANGDDEIMRDYIMNGTPRMPGFKYYLKADEISAIISYVRTVPVPAAAPAR
jgi:mono/diheme cytochrome c family protein